MPSLALPYPPLPCCASRDLGSCSVFGVNYWTLLGPYYHLRTQNTLDHLMPLRLVYLGRHVSYSHMS